MRYPNDFKKKVILFSLLLTGITLNWSCKKEDDDIPNVSVDIYIYPSDPNFIDLNAIGGWVYITGGSRGILVYRQSNEDFIALERHCTFEPENSCAKVEVDSSNVILTDPCCGSKFLITDGSVQNGPAGSPLKQYSTMYDGSALHIYN